MTRPSHIVRFAYQTCRAGLARSFGQARRASIGAERDAEWYDLSFTVFRHWKKHYSQSRYFFLWSIVADRLITGHCDSVLDVGCGPGQFACLLRDRGIPAYHGVDFSTRRIAQARYLCPEYRFHAEEAFKTGLFDELQYDAVVMTEVLEHIECDVDLIGRSQEGTRLLASVPNFPSAGHVRHFLRTEEVHERYGVILENIRVDALHGDPHGKIYFLIDGIVRSGGR